MTFILQAQKRAEADRRAAEAAAARARRPPAPAGRPAEAVPPGPRGADPVRQPFWVWVLAVGLGFTAHALVFGPAFVVSRPSDVALVAPPRVGGEKAESTRPAPVPPPASGTAPSPGPSPDAVDRARTAMADAPPQPAEAPAEAPAEPPAATPVETKDAGPPPAAAVAPAASAEPPPAVAPPPVTAPPPAMAPPPTRAYPLPPSRAGRKALARAFAPEPSPDPRAPLWQTHLSTASSNNLWLMEGAEEPETPRVAFDGSRLRIEVLVWAADPGKRMIFVDGRKYVEGEALQPGTILERIAQDGVVLVHQGQRIRVPSQ